jgi:type IV secretory pathway VirB2 component (pilin)
MQKTHLFREKLAARATAIAATGAIAATLLLPAVASAQIPDPSDADRRFGLGDNVDETFSNVGLGQTEDLKGSIANIINIILGFLGIVAVIIILAGGFKWMTAGGNEDKVAESRQMIIQGVIGLVIVFAAWAIASFVVSNLQSATTKV